MRRATSPRERGYSLAEILVAVAIFATIFIAALLIYDRSNRMFRSGTEASELQQNTRIAFEKLVSDLRMAGFDYNRDGIPFSSAAGVAVWQPNRDYAIGAVVTPTTANGYTYLCTTAGTSGGLEPTWGNSVGSITPDNSARWTAQAGVNQFEQPDEQIEYASGAAITFRANFDYETHKDAAYGREGALANSIYGKPVLESPQFPVVTTGNDEIVTYALHSEARGAGLNADRIQFYADVPDRRAFPGGRSENLVTIDDVDLCTSGCNNPPYTLLRITLDANGAEVRTPIAENVRSIHFDYYNNSMGSGTAMAFTSSLTATTPSASPNPPFGTANPASSGGGQYNPLSPAPSQSVRAYRSSIQSVRITLIGMNTGKAEAKYVNPAEPAGSPAINYRTFNLTSLVVPRNLGKIGQHEVQESPPGAPKLESVCIGYCGMAKVTWIAPQPSPDEGTVEQYVIIYDTVNPPVKYQQYVASGTSGYVDGLAPGTQYYFTVASVNSYGSRRAVDVLPVGSPGFDPKNKTAPQPASALTASGSGIAGEPAEQDNLINLSWTPPTANVSGADNTTCYYVGGGSQTKQDPVPNAEIDSWEVWRSEDPNFSPPSEGTLVSNLVLFRQNVLNINYGVVQFVDKSAAPCVTYYYRVRGIKSSCYPATAANNTSPGVPYTPYYPALGSPAHQGRAKASNVPAAPATLLAMMAPLTPVSNCGATCTVYLQWPKVKTDATPAPNTKDMTVKDYILTRERWRAGAIDTDTTPGPAITDIPVTDSTYGYGTFVTDASGNQYYTDSGLPSVSAGGEPYQYVYRVRATLACAPATPPSPATSWNGGPSPNVRFPCNFAVSGFNATMSNTLTGDGLTYGSAWLSDGSGSALTVNGSGMTSVQVLLRNYGATDVVDLGTKAPGSPFPIQSGIDTQEGEVYQVFIVMRDANDCLDIKLRYYQEGTASGCCLAAQADDPFVVQFTPNSDSIDVLFKNNCANDLNIQANGIRITWTPGTVQTGTQLRDIEFPQSSGGGTVSTGNINDTSGTVTRSVPTGGQSVISAATNTYKITINFNKTLPSNPLTGVCVSYLRTAIDLTSQNCKIVPQPASFNSCN